jgi:hypothetical protein
MIDKTYLEKIKKQIENEVETLTLKVCIDLSTKIKSVLLFQKSFENNLSVIKASNDGLCMFKSPD